MICCWTNQSINHTHTHTTLNFLQASEVEDEIEEAVAVAVAAYGGQDSIGKLSLSIFQNLSIDFYPCSIDVT